MVGRHGHGGAPGGWAFAGEARLPALLLARADGHVDKGALQLAHAGTAMTLNVRVGHGMVCSQVVRSYSECVLHTIP